jgi:5-methylcytosine-specific restriction protein B
MFSPKVLDRASVIEFRVTSKEMETFFDSPKSLEFDSLRGAGAAMGEDFVAKATALKETPENLTEYFMPFFAKLQEAGAEFGYRSAVEISRFVAVCEELTAGDDEPMNRNAVVDAAIMQKLLPKVHGSRNKIEKILKELARLCLADASAAAFSKEAGEAKYPLSYEKLGRMYTRVIHDGFTSYAEA